MFDNRWSRGALSVRYVDSFVFRDMSVTMDIEMSRSCEAILLCRKNVTDLRMTFAMYIM